MSYVLYTLAAICLFLAVYPFMAYPLTIAFLGFFKRSGDGRGPLSILDAASLPSMAIVFCAHNEARSIDAKLRNVSALMDQYEGESEALFYLDGCTDNTAEIARSFLEKSENKARITLVEGVERAGKSHGMNTILAKTQAEIVIFTDANVELDVACLDVAAKAFQDHRVGCICGHLFYVNSGDSATSEVGSLYWRFEEWLKRLESSHGSTVGADGSLFAIRRELFRPVPSDIIDDMYTSLGALVQGMRIIRVEGFRAQETHVTVSKDEFRRKIRIACRAVNCVRYMWPDLRQTGCLNLYQLIGHKFLRWMVIFNLVGALGFLALGLVLDGAYMLLISMIGLMAGSYLFAEFNIKPFAALREIFLAFVAAGWGLIESLKGKRYQTWAIAQSSRNA